MFPFLWSRPPRLQMKTFLSHFLTKSLEIVDFEIGDENNETTVGLYLSLCMAFYFEIDKRHVTDYT